MIGDCQVRPRGIPARPGPTARRSPKRDGTLAGDGAGANWVGVVTTTPRPNTGSSNSEFYAIFYRAARIKPCDGWTGLQYMADNDGGPSGTGEDLFSREPAFGCFAVRLGDGTTGFDFMLAAYHAQFTGGKAKIKDEVKHVTAVFQAIGQARSGENDRIFAIDFRSAKLLD